MKLSKLSQLTLVSTMSLAVAMSLTACQLVTIDYLFLAGTSQTSSGGAIQVFAVDSESGALRKGAATVDSGGSSPVSLAITSDEANLYVANQGNSSVVHFAIAPNGELTKKDSITLSSAPVAITVNQANNALYVVSGTTAATLTAYSLSSGTIGSATATEPLTVPGFSTDTLVPTNVMVLPNNDAVYVTAYDQSAYNPGGTTTSTANPGWVFGFTAGSGGALTPTSGSPYRAGVKPSALAADPTDRFVYVTDYASNQLIGYAITNGSTLTFLTSGPYKTGNEPTSVAIDPRGKFIYVSNALDSSVTAFAIDLATGIPSAAVNTTGSSVNSTDTQPQAIVVDPALGRFVYTANFLGNSISGFRLNPNTGTIAQTQATPYPSVQNPTAIVSVPHGNHSLQVTAP